MNYRVTALDAKREVIALALDAASEALAADAARERGLVVLSVRSQGSRLNLAPLRMKSRFPVLLFANELTALLEAGLNLVEALQTLTEKEPPGERREVLSGILESIRRGESFSRAVAHFPQHFAPLFVATLKAAERTGNVREALTRYVAYQEELDRVRKKVIAASIYPAILVVVGTLVLSFLIFYVVPRFAQVYEDFYGSLSFFSAALLAVGRTVHAHGGAIAAAALASITGLVWAVAQPAFRAWFQGCLWRIPAIGRRMKVYQLARLYRTIGMLLRAGIPVVQALDMVCDLLAAHLRPRLIEARRLIEQGRPMSAAFGATDLATPVAARMMLVGERSGRMGDMMAGIARFHDEEISRFVDWFTRAFEPLLMTAIGIAVGLVVVLMYMPIFELAGTIQ